MEGLELLSVNYDRINKNGWEILKNCDDTIVLGLKRVGSSEEILFYKYSVTINATLNANDIDMLEHIIKNIRRVVR